MVTEEEEAAIERDRDKRATVLLLAPLPPPIGGMATVTEGLLRSRVAEEFKLVVLRPDVVGKHSLRGALRRGVALLNFGVLAGALVYRIVRHRPRIVHVATNSYAGFFEKALLALAARLAGRRTILHVHGGAFREFYWESPALVKWMIRTCLKWPHLVVTVSEIATKHLSEMGVPTGRVVAWPNAVEVPAAGGSSRNDSSVNVLFLNRTDAAKGLCELVEAAEIVCKRRSEVRFRIVGPDSTTRRMISANVGGGAFAGQVTVEEEVSGDAKERAYREADIYVLPSHVEGMPMGLLEAMSYGLPCVTTPVGGVPEVVTDGINGLLVPAKDVRSLAEAIERLVVDEDLRHRIGDAARRTITEKFSWAERAEQIAAAYRALLFR